MKFLLAFVFSLPLFAAAVEQQFAVQTVTVAKQKEAVSRIYYGHAAADESRMVTISPRFGGFVTRLESDRTYVRVKKGDVLAEVYSPDVLQAKEEYRNAIAYDRQHGNKAMVQSARAKLELLGIATDEIDAIARGKTITNGTHIRAPYDGYLFVKNVKQGSAFKAGMQLFEIVNTDTLWVNAAIYQNELSSLPGYTRFDIRPEGFEGWREAKKELLLPQMDPAQSSAMLRLSVTNGDHLLLPGMYCEIRAAQDAHERLVIPRTAAIRKHGGWYVFSEGEYEGEYEPLRVELKPLDDNRYEVLSGLSEGDIIVNNALFMIDADAQINGLY